MAITGGIKFFTENRMLAVDGAVIIVSSGDTVAEDVIDKSRDTFWRSVGSSDVTTETLTITFGEVQIDRLILQDHNFKGFTVQYWNGSTWTHFANVVGLDGSKANITETAFADTTAYYEFTAVTTTKIKISVTTAQTTNAEKYLCQAIACSEIGTLTGFPQVKTPKFSRKTRRNEMLSGKVSVAKGAEFFSVKLDFEKYPTSLYADLDLAMTLTDRDDPFLVWLCGGRRGASYFRYATRGFRLKDIYCMQATKDVAPEYYRSTYTNPVGLELQLEEHV